MGFFKVLAGVTIGVGAVAAAPFTGGGSVFGAATLMASLTGATTVAAAVGAGATGAAAGYFLDKKDAETYTSEISHAREEGKKSSEIILEKKYQEKLKKAREDSIQFKAKLHEIIEDTEAYHKMCEQIVAIFGIGIAVANCDGYISEEESIEIQELIVGLSGASYPAKLLNAIHALELNPPTFEVAVENAQKAGVTREVINLAIEGITKADHVITPEEMQLISSWKNISYTIQ